MSSENPLRERVADLLGRLTTAEKIDLLHRWRPAVPRPVFPQAIGLASTWNPDLVRAVGDAIATELRGYHHKDPVAHGLAVRAPVVTPLRDPRRARNHEGCAEDPLLTSVLGTAYVSGLRGDHPGYLKTVPTLNETGTCALRARVLHEYEFPVAAVPVLPAPGLIAEEDVDDAVTRLLTLRMRLGEFDPPELNPYTSITDDVIDAPEHRALALEAARQAVVLLKNDGLLPLDPRDSGRIAVIGADVVAPIEEISQLHSGETTFTEGADRVSLTTPDGRFLAVSPEGRAVLEEHWSDATAFDLFDRGQDAVALRSVLACDGGPGLFELVPLDGDACLVRNTVLDQYVAAHGGDIRFVDAPGEAARWRLEVDRSGLARAIAHAAAADVAIVVVGDDPRPGARATQDREHLGLPPRQAELIRAVRQVNPRTVLLVVSSHPYALVWEDEHVPAILWSSHGGQEVRRALADVVFGEVSPSGRLTQTWYRGVEALPDPDDHDIIKSRATYLYFEGDPLYEFGHGLSYSTFSHGPLTVSEASVWQHEGFEVSVEVTNSGDRPGAEVVQLYGTQRESRVVQPLRRLLAFQRVVLGPGESRVVRFPLHGRDFWHWDVVSGRPVVETSVHGLWVGTSTARRARGEVLVIGEGIAVRGPVVRAEDFDDCSGTILVAETPGHGTAVEATEAGGWILLGDTRIDDNATRCRARVAGRIGEVVVRIGDPARGRVLCTLTVPEDQDVHAWREISAPVRSEVGAHDLFVVFTAPGTRLASFEFDCQPSM